MKKVYGFLVCHSIEEIKNNTRYSFSINELDDIGSDFMAYIEDSHIIDFSLEYPSKDSYEKLYNFISRLDKNGNKCKVIVNSDISNRKLFNDVFLNNNFKNVKLYVYSDNCFYTFKDYFKEEEALNNLVLPILKKNLSPLERYIAVYNVVKNFKPYKKHEKEYSKSSILNYYKATCLKYILNNEYIVCLGFSKLLIILCDKVGIKVNAFGVALNKCPDGDKNDVSYHSRCIVSIDDDKYNVHGLYMADPTWDNDFEDNRFNHALMTFDRMQVSRYMFYYGYEEPILDIHSFEEFNEQINFLFRDRMQFYNIFDYNRRLISSYIEVIENVLCVISSDPKFEYFYGIFDKCNNEDEFIKLLTELGNYLVTRINNKIDDKTLFRAILSSGVVNVGYDDEILRFFVDYYVFDKYYFPYRVDKNRKHRLIKKRTIDIKNGLLK